MSVVPCLTECGTRRLERRPIEPQEIVLVTCARNEAVRLPCFLNHHRNIGVDRFIVVDNCSDDGTADILDAARDVVRFVAEGSYSESTCGVEWTNRVTTLYAANHWVLTLDADELFIFPEYEKRTIQSLIRYMETKGANALRAPMIDMYAEGPLAHAAYEPGENLIRAFPFFDATGYEWTVVDGLPFVVRGGPRRRLFWDGWDRDCPSPVLMKIPLVRWGTQPLYTLSTHELRQAKFSGVSGALLHFKLMSDFPDRVKEEVRRQEHFAGARQYVAYSDGMELDPAVVIKNEKSKRLENSQTLVKLGFIHQPEDF